MPIPALRKVRRKQHKVKAQQVGLGACGLKAGYLSGQLQPAQDVGGLCQGQLRACKDIAGMAYSAHLPSSPESAKAATSTEASMTAVTSGPRHGREEYCTAVPWSPQLPCARGLPAATRPAKAAKLCAPIHAEELLHGLTLESGARGKLVSDLFRHVPYSDLYWHDCIMPFLPAFCNMPGPQ